MPAKMVLLSATCPVKTAVARTEMSRSLQAQLITRRKPPGKIPEIPVGNFPEAFGTFCDWRAASSRLYRSIFRTGGAKEAGTERGRDMGLPGLGVRGLLLASVSAGLAAGGGWAHAQDSGSYTTELPPVEVTAPKTATKPARRPKNAERVVRPTVTRLRVYPTTPLASPNTALSVDKVVSSVNFVDTKDIERTGSLNIGDALLQSVPAVNINEVSGNPFQPSVEFRGFVGTPVAGTPQGLAVYQNGVRINE